jgi:23S rRNA (pseudouridine1915-N3)-methyltransferase
MQHIKILSIGKNKESWLQEALHEYEKRLTAIARIDWVLLKKEEQLEEALKKEQNYHCLDPFGTLYTSERFSTFLMPHPSITFVIGGATGIAKNLKDKAASLISLSPLTFTHQHTRLILLEQIYRSHEIQKGSNYHK